MLNMNYDLIANIYWLEQSLEFENIQPLITDMTGDKVIDIPCSTGRRIEYLEKNFGEVYAYDLSEKMVDITRSKYNSNPNIYCKTLDLKEIYIHENNVDYTFIMEYAIHFMNIEELNDFIFHITKISSKIIVEYFDYDNFFDKVKEIQLEIGKIKLKKSYLKKDGYIELHKEYKIKNEILKQKIIMYMYSKKDVVQLFKKYNYNLVHSYSNYKKEFIFNDPRNIFIFERR